MNFSLLNLLLFGKFKIVIYQKNHYLRFINLFKNKGKDK